MRKPYVFTVEGTAADGLTWKTVSKLTCELSDVLVYGMSDSFSQLTAGRAIYGQPGMTCTGPYDVHKITIEQVKQ